MGLDSVKTSAKAAAQQVRQQVAPPPPPPPAPQAKQGTQTNFEQSSFEPAKAKARVALTVPVSEYKAPTAAQAAASATSTQEALLSTTSTQAVAPATPAQVQQVNTAREQLEEAQGRAKSLDEQLAKELADFGPALTDEQRAKYVETFRGENSGIYGSVVEKADALDKLLKEHGPALEAAAVKNGGDADVLYGAYKALASSPKAEAAAQFASRIQAEPNSPLAGAVSRFTNLDAEIAQPAIANTWAQFLSEEPDPEAALARLSKIVKPYVEGVNGSSEVKEAWDKLTNIVKTKQFDALSELAQSDLKNPLVKAFTAAGMALGAYDGYASAKDGKYLEAVKNFAQAGKDGLEVVKFSTEALKNAGVLAETNAVYKGTAAFAGSNFAAKLAPGLGLVASGASFLLNADKVRNGTANFGTGLAITGDLLSFMGSGLALIPGGQAPGSFFVGLGGVVGAVGSYVEGRIEDEQMKASQRRGLTAAGITEPLLSTLVDGEPARMRELQEELGLNAQQIQQLALRYPGLVTNDESEGVSLYNFKELMKDFGLSPQQSYDMLLAVGNGTSDPSAALSNWLLNLKEFANFTPEQWRQGLEERANRPTGSRPAQTDYTTTFRNAFTYLESLSTQSGGDR